MGILKEIWGAPFFSKFTRAAWSLAEWSHICDKSWWLEPFRLDFPVRNFELPFKTFRLFWKFSVSENKTCVTIYISTEISGFLQYTVNKPDFIEHLFKHTVFFSFTGQVMHFPITTLCFYKKFNPVSPSLLIKLYINTCCAGKLHFSELKSKYL